MSSPTTDGIHANSQSKTQSRKDRRKEWRNKNKEFRSKLRDRSTLSKKENEQHQQNSIPTKIDSSRGFRTTVITKMAAAASKPKKSLVSAKKHSQQVKQKVKTAKLNPRPPGKQDKVDKKKPQSMPKPPGPKPTGKLEFVKPEMSEISMNARGVEPSCGVNHMPQRYILFIGNLPYTVDKGQLMVHFRKTGGVKSIRLPKDKSGKGKGFAYIEFKDRISHGIALRLHHTTLGGRRINVEFSTSESKKAEQKSSMES